VSRGNLIATGIVLVLLCPALGTSILTFLLPSTLAIGSALVCPAGTTMEEDYVTHSDFRGQRTDVRAACVDASGNPRTGDVFPQAFLIVYGILLVLWCGVLFWFFRKPATGEPGSGSMGTHR